MVAVYEYLNQSYNWKNLSILFLVAFLLRVLTFGTFLQHNERYYQADSLDYHHSAVCMAIGMGMTRYDNHFPLFWRTPGYPLYLGMFYKLCTITRSGFPANMLAQKASIWVQIFLCSFVPLLLFFLALLLTQSLFISWLSAWISVFHLGFILSCGYILSDALAMLPFLLFLIFFYKCFAFVGEHIKLKPKDMIINVLLAALCLGIYTWIRPNGKFTAILSAIILLFGSCVWKLKLKKIALFLLVFFAIIGGWVIRNYNLTGELFYCPMSGPNLQSFAAPKIVSRVFNIPLIKAHQYMMVQGHNAIVQQQKHLKETAPYLVVSRERVVGRVAWPWIMRYPFYFIYDWLMEVIKTTFDLYSSQLVTIANNTHKWDPIQEFLLEKIQLCLYKQKMPLVMRLVVLLEFIFALFKWFGLFGGLWVFLFKPLFVWRKTSDNIKRYTFLWLKTGMMIGGMLMMTGGFGYARLRLPVDPLLIILSLTFWYWFFSKNEEG